MLFISKNAYLQMYVLPNMKNNFKAAFVKSRNFFFYETNFQKFSDFPAFLTTKTDHFEVCRIQSWNSNGCIVRLTFMGLLYSARGAFSFSKSTKQCWNSSDSEVMLHTNCVKSALTHSFSILSRTGNVQDCYFANRL